MVKRRQGMAAQHSTVQLRQCSAAPWAPCANVHAPLQPAPAVCKQQRKENTCSQAGSQAGRQAGRQKHRQAGRQASPIHPPTHPPEHVVVPHLDRQHLIPRHLQQRYNSSTVAVQQRYSKQPECGRRQRQAGAVAASPDDIARSNQQVEPVKYPP
jgi:hypothetical protein